MTKEEAKQKLRKSGYNVVDDNSVVTVVISADSSMKNAIKDIKDKLNSWGFNSSFGIRQHKGVIEGAEMDETDEALDMELDDENEEIAEEEIENQKKTDAILTNDVEVTDTTSADKSATVESDDSEDDDEYYDEEDSDMLLTEESIQFSLEDFGLDF